MSQRNGESGGLPSEGRDRSIPVPYVSMSVTTQCNFRCCYCPPNAESYGTAAEDFDPAAARDVVIAAHELGVRKIRLTGGEPLLYPHLESVLSVAAEKDIEVHINTNGSLVVEKVGLLQSYPKVKLKVSLDTLDPETFRRITPSGHLSSVVRGLRVAAEAGILERIGTVVTRVNFNDVEGCLGMCRALGIGIKILDIYMVPEMQESWRASYAPPSALRLRGERLRPNPYTTHFGIPTTELLVDGVPVRIKDSRKGTHYHEICGGCPHFPCQEGLYCLLVAPRMRVIPCRLGFPFFRDCRNASDLLEMLSWAFAVYRDSHHETLFWNDKADLWGQGYQECLDTRSSAPCG